MVFITGVAGQLFKDQSLTVTFALSFSLLVALTLVPMLAGGPGARLRTGRSPRASRAASGDALGRVADGLRFAFQLDRARLRAGR